MTTKQSQSIDKVTKMRAAYIATQLDENVVVYEMKCSKGNKRVCPLGLFQSCKENPDVEFIATIDKDGNYVD